MEFNSSDRGLMWFYDERSETFEFIYEDCQGG